MDFALTARVLRRSTRNLVDRVEGDGTWTRAVEALVTRLFSLERDLAPFWHCVRRERGFAELAP